MLLFGLDASRSLAHKIALALDTELAPHEERDFEDGEHKARPLVSVRGRDVFVVHSLHGEPEQSPNDKLCRLLFFLAAVKDNGAARVTAVIPYLAYARKDRQTKSRDPITTRYMAQLLEAMGVDCVVTLEVHNIVAFQNAFRCRSVHLDPRRLFAERARELIGTHPAVVMSPDPGGVKRAQLFRETLETVAERPVDSAFMEKRRSAGVVSGELLVGPVDGATVLIIDDLISTGGTIARAARACRDNGARQVFAFAAHGLFVGEAGQALADPGLTRTFATDTVPPFRLDQQTVRDHLEIVSAAPLFGEAIRRLHQGGSINELVEGSG
jgi:ribose-phosphate pyrophosphokinase